MSNTEESKQEGTSYYKYTGETQPKNETTDPNGRIYYPYLPSPDLIEAVNLAIALKRPLLLEGEPGCGKTRLAGAVAYEFTQKQRQKFKENGEDKQNWWWDYYIWNVKSTTRARDGLYRYDAVARLRDAQFIGTNPQGLVVFLGKELKVEELKKQFIDSFKRVQDKKKYRTIEPLGKALGAEKENDLRPILLIDEIDKADSDFANDLLLELEELRFEIPETGESFSTPPDERKPIIFITSNNEKPLPEAFLRRCLYFYVDFPKEERLEEIINQRVGALKDKKEIVNKATNYLYKIREHLKQYPGSKAPGTSEFIDFLDALAEREKPLEDLDNLFNRTALLGILLKTKEDQKFISEFLKNQKSQDTSSSEADE